MEADSVRVQTSEMFGLAGPITQVGRMLTCNTEGPGLNLVMTEFFILGILFLSEKSVFSSPQSSPTNPFN